MDSGCTAAASHTLRLLFELKKTAQEKQIKSESVDDGKTEGQIIASHMTKDIDTTIRILRQTNLK